MLSSGKRLGCYEILATIGVGGMGEVYKARDLRLDRIVAIKVLPEEIAGDPGLKQRFEREAKAISSLSHPHICTLFDVGSDAGVEFLVMEYLEGETAAQRLSRGPLPLQQALRYGVEIAEALERAHRQGVTHRDLKPGNVMLTKAGAKLLDFGLAKLKPVALEREAGAAPTVSPEVTASGTILGTLQYMAPEQIEGHAVDHRADIFALGAILYELVTGQKAFNGQSQASLIGAILKDEPLPISQLQPLSPPALDAIVATCLAKDPDDRWQSAGDVGRQLQLLQGSSPSAVVPPPSARSVLRRPSVAAALAAVIATAALGAFAIWSFAPPTAPAPRSITRFVVTPTAEAPLASTGGIDLAISPDGRRIAYVAMVDGGARMALYVRELDALEPRRLPGTEIPPIPTVNPFFSPDGRSIGYYAVGQGIMRVALSGGPPVKIADDPTNFAGGFWTEDGAVIFASGDGLYRVPATGGGQPERLASGLPDDVAVPPEGTVYVAPSLLPDNNTVLFALASTSRAAVGLMDLETRRQRVLLDGVHPSFARSGHVIFARGTSLMAAQLDPNGSSVAREPVAVLEGIRRPAMLSAPDYALSASGTLAYVTDVDISGFGGSLVWVDRAGQEVAAVNLVADNPRHPRLSPEGRRLLLTTGQNDDGDLWIYDLEGRRPPFPLITEGDNVFGAWSPDGTQIAFMTGNAATRESYRAYRIAADGSGQDPQPLPGALGVPESWLSDGTLVLEAYAASPRDIRRDIVALDLNGDGEIRDLVASAADFEAQPSVSPDERWLAYTSDRTGQPEIWVKRLPDGIPERLSREGGVEPEWSRDGRELFYRQGTAMMAVTVPGDAGNDFGVPVQLFDGPYRVLSPQGLGTSRSSFDVAPDGRFLMIRRGDEGASIVVIQNWTEELERLVPAR